MDGLGRRTVRRLAARLNLPHAHSAAKRCGFVQATDLVGRGHLERLWGRRRSTDRVDHVSTSASPARPPSSVLRPSGQRSALVFSFGCSSCLQLCLLSFVMVNELVSRLGLSRSLTASPTHARSLVALPFSHPSPSARPACSRSLRSGACLRAHSRRT